MKLTLFLSFLILSTSPLALDSGKTSFFVTIGSDAAKTSQNLLSKADYQVVATDGDISVMELSEDSAHAISHMMHDDFKRCGGYIRHESLAEALEELNSNGKRNLASQFLFADYSINQEALVENLIGEVEESNIRATIEKLSSFHNRYYKAQTGVDSQDWLYNRWQSIGSVRSDVSVEKWKHASWPQPSVILTLEGKTDEVIVIGGHADSVAGWWGRERAHAPGADDNASGIATITETLRILIESGYKPEKTIKFMGYAAEEVGLLGSKEIAKKFKSEGKKVAGVLQLDMTNYKGSSNFDIVMMTDYTNEAQNKFLGTLIDRYLPGLAWGYDRCGYGCSDHASWHGQGFPASMPFEARKNDMNGNIHTNRDTLDLSNGNANHAVKFAKLAVAYAIELDK